MSVTIAIAVMLGIGLTIVDPNDRVSQVVAFSAAINAAVSLYFIGKNHVERAGHIYVFGLWLAFFGAFFFQEGVRSAGYSVIISLIFSSGLLLGTRIGTILTTLSCVFTLLLIGLESAGLIQSFILNKPLTSSLD